MCGIIGVLGKSEAAPLLVEGLKRLEYRGYDSAGIATLVDGKIDRRRAEGKLVNLASLLEQSPLGGTVGIGHTRWATHGIPDTTNAHPHSDGNVAVVHNGIIENFAELKEKLAAKGCQFETDTDTEVLVHLISDLIGSGLSPKEAVGEMLPKLEGAFALAILFSGEQELMIGARRGSPLAVGYGEGEMYLGSDALSLAHLTNRICYMEEGDWAILRTDGAEIYDDQNRPANREIRLTALSGAMIGKGQYRHFMEKEIFEQPTVIGDTLHSHLNPQSRTVHLTELPFDFKDMDRLTIVACGTAFYAGWVAKYWFEQIARLPVEIDIASEFRYREAPLPKKGGAIFISQSGETIDTLAALRFVKGEGYPILSIVNAIESTIARESDAILSTLAGPEIGVASTKAFTTQLTVLACLAIAAAKARGTIKPGQEAELTAALTEVPAKAAEILNHDGAIAKMAHSIAEARDVLYLARGNLYPIALEGALKLKEISYIHAEGYAAGEMKHGPIALIDENVPVVICAPSGPLFEKTASNLEEVAARGGQVYLFTDKEGCKKLTGKVQHCIELPEVHPFVSPILYSLPIQMLAYHTAVLKGTDVDQPRNLAKSVTVE